MAITKRRNVTWKEYVRDLAESPHKLTEIEKIELSGLLLRRDMDTDKRTSILHTIFSKYDYEIADIIAAFLITESPDTSGDLLHSIKTLVSEHYTAEIKELIANEMQLILEENSSDDPRDEFDPNDYSWEARYVKA